MDEKQEDSKLLQMPNNNLFPIKIKFKLTQPTEKYKRLRCMAPYLSFEGGTAKAAYFGCFGDVLEDCEAIEQSGIASNCSNLFCSFF
jgi:hypothetical protein